jgi:hypothetical protein
MFSPRRRAQLALGAASLILVASITVLIAGSSDTSKNNVVPSGQSQVTPLANSQLESMQSDLAQRIASAKQ